MSQTFISASPRSEDGAAIVRALPAFVAGVDALRWLFDARATLRAAARLTPNAAVVRSFYATGTALGPHSRPTRYGAVNEADWDNVAEAIEDLAASERREIRNRRAVLCGHL
jgi:hypothetical protein